MKELQEELKKVIIDAQKILEEDRTWENRYEQYANLMLKYRAQKQELGKKFREWKPLKFYTTIGASKTGATKLEVSVRYLRSNSCRYNCK